MSEGKTLRKQIEELTDRLRHAESRIAALSADVRRLQAERRPTDAVGSEPGVAEIAEAVRQFFPQGHSRNG